MNTTFCKICSVEWGISKYVVESSYICPDYEWKIRKGVKIELGGKKKK